MRFKITNHRAKDGHPLSILHCHDSDREFTNIAMICTGNGATETATRKAMALVHELRALPVGGTKRVQTEYLNAQIKKVEIDVTFERKED